MIVGYLVADDGGPLTRGRKKLSKFSGRRRWRAALVRPIGIGGVVHLFGSRAAAVAARNRAERNGEAHGLASVYEVRT